MNRSHIHYVRTPWSLFFLPCPLCDPFVQSFVVNLVLLIRTHTHTRTSSLSQSQIGQREKRLHLSLSPVINQAWRGTILVCIATPLASQLLYRKSTFCAIEIGGGVAFSVVNNGWRSVKLFSLSEIAISFSSAHCCDRGEKSVFPLTHWCEKEKIKHSYTE